MALSAAGVGVFAYPHPLHNVFGISELVGYQAPLVYGVDMETPFAGKKPCFRVRDSDSSGLSLKNWMAELASASR